ncbi:MAG TPA: hypothetical protein VF193_11980 [Steroidobacter sp.]
MHISIRNTTGGATEIIEKNVSAGRTVIRAARGQQLEVVDEATGRAPAQLRVRRGGPNGEDLIVESNGEILEIHGFFEMASEGEDAVSVSFPGGEVPELTPAMLEAQFAAADWAGAAPFADGQAVTMAAASGASSAAAAAGGAAASGISTGWLVVGALAAAGVGAAVANDDDDDGNKGSSPDPEPKPEPEPTFELGASSDEVDEGADVVFTLTTTNVAPGTQYEYVISGVSAADIEGGKLSGTVTIGADGKAMIPVWLVEDLKTEGVETLKITVAGQTYEITVNDTSTTPVPDFKLEASTDVVDEGADVVFTLTTTNVAPGTQYEYEISGVSASDVVGGKLTGTVTIDANGQALIPVSLVEDLKTEGVETLEIKIAGETYKVTVNDTSTTPVAPEPEFKLTASAEAVDEGSDITFTLATSNVAPGTQFEYEITGVSAADVVGGKLTGTVTIDANGQALISVSLAADRKTEGPETLEIKIAGETYRVTVNDTSLTQSFVLTPDIDDITGTDVDELVYGSSSTYNPGDKIDGGEGNDTLDLSLTSGTTAESVTVKNVETVNVTTSTGTDGVTLRMSEYDGSVQKININNARATLVIEDQQSVADVSITDTNVAVTLDYDDQVVDGESDTLNADVREFGGSLSIDEGIESLNLAINDGKNEASAFDLTASGATEVNLSGGRAEHGTAIDLEINSDRAAGAIFDGREFAGDLTLTGLEGGERTYSRAIEFTQGLEPGQTATISLGGELTITVEAGDSALTADELAEQFASRLNLALGTSGAAFSAGEVRDGVWAVIVHNLRAPASSVDVSIDIAGATLVDDFSYDVAGEDVSPDTLDRTRSSEVSTLLLGDGDDSVSVDTGDITYEDTYDLGNGKNTLVVSTGNVYGTVKFGDGGSALIVGQPDTEGEAGTEGDIGGAASISFGEGENFLWVADGAVTGQASITFAGGDNAMQVEENIDGLARVEFDGDGDNSLFVGGEIAGPGTSVAFNGDGDNSLVLDIGSIAYGASVSFGNGDNTLFVGEHIASGASVSFGDGDNTAYVAGSILSGEDFDLSSLQPVGAPGPKLSFGDGNNELVVGGAIAGWGEDNKHVQIEFGNGDNLVRVTGLADEDVVRHATLHFGDGDNTVQVSRGVSSSELTFGDGDNEVTIGGNVSSSEVTFGSGNDRVSVGMELQLSTIDMGDGDNVLNVGGNISQGSNVSFGSGADNFLLGGSNVTIRGEGEGLKSTVDLGDGDDKFVIVRDRDADLSSEKTIVRSGAVLLGGEGDDTLEVRAADDIELIARTSAQTVTVTLDGDYRVGDVVSVTIGEDTYTYEVKAEDIVQGDVALTQYMVTEKLLGVLEDDSDEIDDPVLSPSQSNNVITLTGTIGAADVEVSAQGATVEVTQYADAQISGFEKLTLVAEDPSWALDNDTETAEITVDFDPIQGVERINLTSEVKLSSQEVAGEGIVNGAYTHNEEGSVAVFNLNNLTDELSQSITVSANEVTATGNRQVERITIGTANGAHAIGQAIAVTIDCVEYSITITEDDLLGDNGQADANAIAARLAEVLRAGDHGFTVAVDNNVITLVGSSDESVSVCLDSEGTGDKIENLQCATVADDGAADVIVNAHLSEAEDTDSDTLALTLDGSGAFDVAIDAEADVESRYEHLVIDVQDEYSHTIDTAGDGHHREFAGGTMRLQGGAAGAAIVFNEVAAKEFTSTSEADVTVNFVEAAEPGGEDWDYAYRVTTLGGNDTVDMSQITLTSKANIDLGAGEDRLVIANGRIEAANAIESSDPFVLDRMFQNVRNVEILEIAGNIGGSGEDEIVFDQKAFDAGFEQVVIDECVDLKLQVGEAFNRELSIKAADEVEFDLSVYSDKAISITTKDDLEASVRIDSNSSADLSVTADDDLCLSVLQLGSGAITVEADDDAYVWIGGESENGGDVTVSVGDGSQVHVLQNGEGAVNVTVDEESHVHITAAGEEGEFDISVTQLYSDENSIILERISEEQNVSVQVAVRGGGKSSYIATFDSEYGWDEGEDRWDTEGECADGATHLEVRGSSGGIDTLTLTSQVDENGEVSAAGVVAVIVDDSWAVAGEGEGADFTIDASAVVTTEPSYGDFVWIDATQETDARLEIKGSTASSNYLFGGAQADRITGGDSADLLYGGIALTGEDVRPRQYTIRFGEDFTAGEGLTFTFDVDGAGGEDAIIVSLQAGEGFAGEGSEALEKFLEALEALPQMLDVEYGPFEYVGEGLWTFGEGESLINIYLDGPTMDPQEVADLLSDFFIQGGWDGEGWYLTIRSDSNDEFTLEVNYDDWVEFDSGIDITDIRGAADVLDGGEGPDLYVIAYSQLDPDQMTTIEGLNLDGVDKINLGSIFQAGDYDALDEGMVHSEGQFLLGGEVFGLEEIEGQGVVNNGLVVNIDDKGDTLEEAVNELFKSNNFFASDADNDAAVNSAGLFEFDGETYLIAVGAVAEDHFGADDFIVKVTGVEGTLDASDFYYFVPMYG